MGVTVLLFGAKDFHFSCSIKDLNFLRLFIFRDEAAYAYHCNTTHHKGPCPLVISYIQTLKK